MCVPSPPLASRSIWKSNAGLFFWALFFLRAALLQGSFYLQAQALVLREGLRPTFAYLKSWASPFQVGRRCHRLPRSIPQFKAKWLKLFLFLDCKWIFDQQWKICIKIGWDSPGLENEFRWKLLAVHLQLTHPSGSSIQWWGAPK